MKQLINSGETVVFLSFMKMNNECIFCESSVRQDLMPIHIKHYHNIPQDDVFSRLFSRIEALEKQVEDLTKENAKHSELIPKDKNFLEKEDIAKIIVNQEPGNDVSLSNLVNKCQSGTPKEITKDKTKENVKVINDEGNKKKTEVIQEEEPVHKSTKIISPRKIILAASAKKRTCPYCLKKLSHWSLFRHINDKHKVKSSSVTCKLCKKQLRNKNSLYCHMWYYHKGAKAYCGGQKNVKRFY